MAQTLVHKYQKGDWISFLDDREIVIGEVVYKHSGSATPHAPPSPSYITTRGFVWEDSVLEFRMPPTPQKVGLNT